MKWIFHLKCGWLVLWMSVPLGGQLLAVTESQAPESLESVQTLSQGVLLSVDKSSAVADLRVWLGEQTGLVTVKRFKIALGKIEGDKKAEGDRKTPEGIYFTNGHISTTNLPKKYGSHAISLNYPNPVDRMLGKTGYGIWLHGVESADRIEMRTVTDGCIAFYNNDIEWLKNWLLPQQGIVVVAEDAESVNRSDDIELVTSATRGWLAAWKSRDIASYMSSYSDKFSHIKGQSWSAYKAYKKRVFDSYNKMEVEIENLRVVTHDKYAVSLMNQNFSGDGRFSANGRKILYWKRTPDGWKIVREKYQPIRFHEIDLSDISLQTNLGEYQASSPDRKLDSQL